MRYKMWKQRRSKGALLKQKKEDVIESIWRQSACNDCLIEVEFCRVFLEFMIRIKRGKIFVENDLNLMVGCFLMLLNICEKAKKQKLKILL